MDRSKYLAYPEGLPEGWSKDCKVLFIGHSQGGQTIRYLQHLLKIDYFNQSGFKAHPIDNSDWIASVTCLNPSLNGGIASYFVNFDYYKNKILHPETENGSFFGSWFVNGCKAYSVI